MKAKFLLLSLAMGGALSASAVPACELLSATPAPGTAFEYAGLPLGRDYTFNTNINTYVGYVEADLYDVTGNPEEPEWITGTYAYHTVGSNDPITISSYEAYTPLLSGHEYEWTVTLYDQEARPNEVVGTFKVLYKGASASYEYSTIQAIAVSPNPNTYIIEDVSEGHFTVSFSGPVDVDKSASMISHGMSGQVPYESITSNAAKTDWTFVIPEDELEERVINCFILAKDSEGRTVLGNEDMEEYQNGEGDNAGFMFTYTSQLAGASVVVTPEAGSTVSELKTFVITSTIGYPVMNPSWTDYPYFMKDKEFIYKWNLEDDAVVAGSKATLTLPDDKVPTESGRYQLILPHACFMFQISLDDQGGYANKYTVCSYRLNLESKPEVEYVLTPAAITPTPGNVNEISTLDIHFAEDMNLVKYDAFILDEAGETVAKADINYDEDFSNLTDFHVTFSPAITAVGNYTFYIPQGTFGNDSYAETGRGLASAEIRQTYSIGTTSASLIGADAASGNVYSVTGACVLRDAKASDLNALPKGVYILNGKKIVVR